ncbi:MAG: zinc-binding dehydrogenase [Fuerstiella sp.]|nr:zinc-binding dehydrogenase [Fuerstiella sp.]
MKALVKTAAGIGHLELLDLPEPIPAPDQLKVQVKFGAICGTDLHICDDEYVNCPPMVLGHEMSGVVVEAGEQVTKFQVGDRVTSETFRYTCGRCRFCRDGLIGLCPDRRSMGVHVDGAFAEYVCQREESLHRLPDNVSFEAGAMSEPTAVAVRAVYERATISAGDVVLISGPGVIGLLCLQAVKAHEARVILVGTAGDEQRLALGRELGADLIINTQTDSLDAVLEFTDGLGADVAVECAGSAASLDQCITLVRKAAQVVTVGLPGRPVSVDLDQAIIKELTILPSFTYSHETWRRALELLEAGKISTTPLVSRRFPLTEWKTAFETVRSRQGLKCLLEPVG